jgi:hypothetical protein
MSDSSKRRSKTDSPGIQPLPGQGVLPCISDAIDEAATPDVQANGQPVSDGRAEGHPGAVADRDEPEADPYNLEALRLSQDFAAAVGVKKLTTTVPVRKPSKEWYVRTHPDPAYRLQTVVLELKEDREVYLVSPSLWPELASEPTFSPRLLIAAVNRQGILFLWPIRLPGADGKIDDWSRSALDAAGEAESRWIRVTANMSLQAYEITAAPRQVPEPVWPDLTFQQIIKIAFRDNMIDGWNHPVLQRLRGEV